MKTRNILILTLMGLMIFAMASCNLFFGIGIEERIDAFNSDVANENWDILYTHFHPDTQERSDMKTGWDYWGTTSFGNPGAQIEDDYSVSGNIVTGTFSLSGDVYVEMELDGWDYKIRVLTITNGSEDLDIRSFQ